MQDNSYTKHGRCYSPGHFKQEKQLTGAHITLSEDFEGNGLTDHVREHILKQKPEHMVPLYIIELAEIPLNVNWKVDKSALPDVDMESLHAEYVASTNEIERHNADAFEDVFNQKGIGLNDDFVRLSGDSITTIWVISLLEKNDIICSTRDILNYKTPYVIAQNVESIESILTGKVIARAFKKNNSNKTN